jgi:gamma-glutamyl-gamma-aminobutyrate hydrolase PuuD
MSNPTQVTLLIKPGEPIEPFMDAIEHADGNAVLFGGSTNLTKQVGGLLIAGVGAFGDSDTVPLALVEAIESGIPVLGIGWGMHALNIALGGLHPIEIKGHGDPAEDPTKHPVFMAPGGKVGYTIAGSGWVTVPSAHTHGLLPAQVADGSKSRVENG